MIQSTSSATSVAALNASTTKAAAAAAKSQPAAAPAIDPAKAVAALKAADAQAFLQRQQVGAALYDRSFTYDEGIKALKRQDAIAAYAQKIQSQPGGPTEKQLARLALKQERAQAQIERLSNNKQGADLNSLKAIDGKVIDDTQANLAARIANGVKDGSLTAEEAKVLTEGQQKLADLEKSLRETGGKLTAGEQKMVMDELRKSADAINKARNNTVGVAVSTFTYADSVNSRQAALEKQLEQGLKIGSLTEAEAASVRQQFDVVNAAEKEALASGSINWREATGLSSLMNEAEAQLYELQRNTDGKQLAEVYVNPDLIDQRQTAQLETITRGIDNRSLTNAEAMSLLEGQKAIDAQQETAVAGGMNRAEYLRLQSAMNDQSLAANTLASNTVRYTGLVPPKAAEVIASVKPVAPAPVSPAPVSPAPVSPAPVSVGPAPTAPAPAPAPGNSGAAPGQSTTAPGNSGSTPAVGNGNGNGNGNGSAVNTPVAPAPVATAPAPATPVAATPVAATPAPAPAAAAPVAAPVQPSVATTVSEQVQAETKAETQPSTPQINRELANTGDVLPDLLRKAFEAQREDLKRYAEHLAEKAEASREQAARENARRSEGKREEHGAHTMNAVYAPGAVRSAEVDAKVGSYARTAATTSTPAAPMLAKKVA